MEVVEVWYIFAATVCPCVHTYLVQSIRTYMGHKALNAAYFRASYVSVSKIYLK